MTIKVCLQQGFSRQDWTHSENLLIYQSTYVKQTTFVSAVGIVEAEVCMEIFLHLLL